MERVNMKELLNFCVHANGGGGYNEWFLSLFGFYVFYWGGGNGDSLTGEEFCGKTSVDNLSLLIIYNKGDWKNDISNSSSAFSVAGPAVWNSLPDCLRDPAVDCEQFRRDLKTYLFAGHSRR